MNIRRIPFTPKRRGHIKMHPKRIASALREYNFFQFWTPVVMLGQIDKPLDTIFKIFKLFFYTAISLGVILILVYCGRIEYFPSGLTIGDGVVFVGACLYFALLYTLFTMLQFSAGLSVFLVLHFMLTPFVFTYLGIAKALNKTTTLSIKDFLYPIRFDVLIFSSIGLLWIGVIAVVPNSVANFDSDSGFAVSIAVMTSFCCMWTGAKRMERIKGVSNTRSSKNTKIACIAGIIVSPALISGYQGTLVDRAMTLMGVRIENVSVQLEESHSQLAKQHGLEPLKIKEGQNRGYFPECDLLLMGIGANVVVEIKGVKLIVPSDKIVIVKGRNATNNDEKPLEVDHHPPDLTLTLRHLQRQCVS